MIAERAAALGGIAEGTVATAASRTSLPSHSLTIRDGRDHVEALARALAAYGKLARAGIQKAEDACDADTSDLFIGISRKADQLLWSAEAHLHADR